MTDNVRPLDVERIAFVTRRFHELRGLPGVIFGSSLVLAVVMSHAFDRPDRSSLQFVMMAMIVANSFAMPLDLWYRRTFGEIVVTPLAEFAAVLPILGPMCAAFLDILLQTTGRPIPSIAAVVQGAFALAVLARDWRRRPYYVLALAAGVAGTIVTANAPASPGSHANMLPARAHAFLLAYTWVGLSQAIAAFLDHRWLATTLTARPRPEEPSPGGLILATSNGRFRAMVAGFVLAGTAGSFALDAEWSAALLMVAPSFAFLFAVMMRAGFRARRLAAHQRLDVAALRLARLEQQAALVGEGPHALWLAVAAAGAADAWMLPPGRFLLLPLGLAAWSAWVATSDWPERRHYLLGAMLIAASIPVSASLPAPRSLALLLAAVSGSLVVEGLLDYRLFKRRSRPAGLAIDADLPQMTSPKNR